MIKMLGSKNTKLITLQKSQLFFFECRKGFNNIMTLPSQENLSYNSLPQGEQLNLFVKNWQYPWLINMTRRKYLVSSKGNYDSKSEIKENNNFPQNDYYYYKSPFKENGKLDDMFDFE